MTVTHDAIKSHDFPSHLKTRDLFAAIGAAHAGFEESCANGVERVKGVSVSEQLLSTFETFSFLNNVFDAIEVAAAEVNRHTQLAQIAIGAGRFNRVRVHNF
jgi:hypothetical protein